MLMYTHFSNTISWSRLDGGLVYADDIVCVHEGYRFHRRSWQVRWEVLLMRSGDRCSPHNDFIFPPGFSTIVYFPPSHRLNNRLLCILPHWTQTCRVEQKENLQVKPDRDISRAEPMCAPYLGQLDIRPIITTPKLFLFTIKQASSITDLRRSHLLLVTFPPPYQWHLFYILLL